MVTISENIVKNFFEQFSKALTIRLKRKGTLKETLSKKSKIPINVIQFSAYMAIPYNKYPSYLCILLNALKEVFKDYDVHEITNRFLIPNKVLHNFYFYLYKQWSDLSKKDFQELTRYLLNILINIRKNDPFCISGRNIILDKKSIERIYHNYQDFFINLLRLPTNEHLEWKRTLKELIQILFCYFEYLFWARRRIGYIHHGPYILSQRKETLLVWNYYDFKPKEIWPCVKDIPLNNLSIYIFCHYNMINEIKEFFDITEKELYDLDSLLKFIKRVLIVVNEKIITDVDQIRKIIELVKKYAVRLRVRQQTMKKEEFKRKFLEITFYMSKPIMKMLNKGWQPPKYYYEYILNEEIIKEPAFKVQKLLRSLQKLLHDGVIDDKKCIKLLMQYLYYF